jgi:hypothetical protein
MARGVVACRIVTSVVDTVMGIEMRMLHLSDHTRLSQTLATCVLEAFSRYDVLTLYTGGQ